MVAEDHPRQVVHVVARHGALQDPPPHVPILPSSSPSRIVVVVVGRGHGQSLRVADEQQVAARAGDGDVQPVWFDVYVYGYMRRRVYDDDDDDDDDDDVD